MKLIVGLGNPGCEYDNTRHNIGFMVLDHYLNSKDWKKKFDGVYQIITIDQEKVLFLKPLTYMNLSGNSVVKAVKFYNIEIQDILVIQDDLDISFGKYRLKKNSSHGGHNGIKSIISALNSNQFSRLKIGIQTTKKDDVINFVLGKFSKIESDQLSSQYDVFFKIIESFILKGIDQTMNDYNH
ncbi:MAG: aminoacyl-tRNA hydrolase [Bacilli bacterium]|jgi:PTH1 family peptidyl-tRNA hydrolase|nr:aminoacyl-tRNA hydrolase [Bacilli bacterium]